MAGYYMSVPQNTEALYYKDSLISLLVECSKSQRITFEHVSKDENFGMKSDETLGASKIAYLLHTEDPFVYSAKLEGSDITFFYALAFSGYKYYVITLKLCEKEKYKKIHAFTKLFENETFYKYCNNFVNPNKVSDVNKWNLIIRTILATCTDNEMVTELSCTSFEEYLRGKPANSTGLVRAKDYVLSLGEDQLFSVISDEFNRVSGTSYMVPTLGSQGEAEYSSLLLLWNYCRKNYDPNYSVISKFMINVGDTIGCAFYCMTIDEIRYKIDKFIGEYPEIISATDFDFIVDYVENACGFLLSTLEFTRTIYDLYSRDVAKKMEQKTYEEFCNMYNSTRGFNGVFKFFQNSGIRLLEDMPFTVY